MTIPVDLTRLEEILITEAATVMVIDTFSISHSLFSSTQHLMRNYVPGAEITATLEDSTSATFIYVPTLLERATQSGTLNQTFTITFQDLNEIIQAQEDLIPVGTEERPTIEIRSFEFNKATQQVVGQIEGPFVLRLDDINYDNLGATITAAPINTTQASTGRLMTTLAVQSLLGFTR